MPRYFDFQVTLQDIDPPIWRRFLLAADDTTFFDLHAAIQDADTWLDMHLWHFQAASRRGRILAETPADEEMGIEPMDQAGPPADEVPLSTFFQEAGQRCIYLYDHGDGWAHEVALKQVVELPESFYRRLTDGRRAFPPEDCGGPPGYYLCWALVGPASAPPIDLSDLDEEEREERREWVGEWAPEEFELEATKEWFDGDTRREVAEHQEALLDELDEEMDRADDEFGDARSPDDR